MSEINLGFEIKKLTNLMKRKFLFDLNNDKHNKNITKTQGIVIGFIMANKDKQIFQKDIENELQIRASSATECLTVMEQNGLIERKDVVCDARKKQIILTEKAKKIYKDISEKIARTEEEMLNGVTDEEKQVLLHILQKMQNNLKEQ